MSELYSRIRLVALLFVFLGLFLIGDAIWKIATSQFAVALERGGGAVFFLAFASVLSSAVARRIERERQRELQRNVRARKLVAGYHTLFRKRP